MQLQNILLAALALGAFLMSNDITAAEVEKKEFAGDGKTLKYCFVKPKAVEKGTLYPLVIFLHGAGERGDDNQAQLKHGMADITSEPNRQAYPCFVIAPQCPEGKRWVEVDWSADSHAMPKEPSEPMKLLMGLIDEAVKTLPVDPKRIYLTGLSMGGYGAWDLAARLPKRFAAVVPICGGADESTAAAIKDVPVWAFHGAKDGAVKVERSRRMIAALKKAGGSPKYTEYPEEGHFSWVPAYRDAELYKWMFAQKRD